MRVVLDASALLALLNAEPGPGVITEAVPEAAISAVNLSEVVAKLAEGGMPEGAIREALDGLGLDIMAFDAQQTYTAGLLRPLTRSLGLSLGDRACLALGLKLRYCVLTVDQDWATLDLGQALELDVKLVR
jgi:PIN domain nuclease of toxin-antitoxin system